MTLPRLSAPPAVRWITRTLEDAGYETWAVGGAVRNVLLGRPAGDWDLTTRARPEDMRRLFRRTVPLGVEHGTVGVLASDGVMFEVTTFRRDVETDGRHAVVAFADAVEDDLGRRDFTINAIAWHALRETLLDPYGGVEDLKAGVLRCVGGPERRFAEDFLRVLRACRFAGRFGLDVEPETWHAMMASVGNLRHLSAERIREELVKILDGDPVPSRALGLYRSSGIMGALYPELAGRSDDAWTASLDAVDRLPPGRPMLRLAMLLRGLDARSVAQLLVRLRLSNVQTEETAMRAGAPPLPTATTSDADVRRWLSRVGPRRLTAVARLELAAARSRWGKDASADAVDPASVVAAWRRARAILSELPALEVKDLALDGRDLIRLGLRPGPEFRRILEDLLERVLDEPDLNRKERLEAEVATLVDADGGETVQDG
ncbi:MAG: tRNA cytidylyltransferase [Gemmatimonadetes bacterium]|nr:tRNA cytidylyltransferase [Gemmatimonadota bacterium]